MEPIIPGSSRPRRTRKSVEPESDVQVISPVIASGSPRSKKPKTAIPGNDGEVRAPIPRTTGRLTEGDQFQLLANKRSGLFSDLRADYKDQLARQKRMQKAGAGFSSSVFDGLRNFQEDAQILQQGPSRPMKTLTDLYRPPVELLVHGSFDDAKAIAVGKKRWLLVNIHNCLEFQCQIMIRDCLRVDAVKEIIKENFVFWQVNHDTSEGLRFCSFYKVQDFPHMAIIDPRTGEQVERFGQMVAVDFCNQAWEFLAEKPTFEDDAAATSSGGPSKDISDGGTNGLRKLESRASIEVIDPEQEELELALRLSAEEAKRRREFLSEIETVADSDDSDTRSADSEAEENLDDVVAFKPIPKTTVEDYKAYCGSQDDPMVSLKFRAPEGKTLDLQLPNSSKIKAILLFVEKEGYEMAKFSVVMPSNKLKSLEELGGGSSLAENGFSSRELLLIQEK